MDLKALLFERVLKAVSAYGFSLNTKKDNFLRLHDGVTDIFQLACKDDRTTGGIRVQPGVAVRIESVEEIFHRTSGFEKQFQKDTPTVGAPVGALFGGGSPRACEFLLTSARC